MNILEAAEQATIEMSRLQRLAGYDFSRLDNWSEKDTRRVLALFTAGLSMEEAEMVCMAQEKDEMEKSHG